MTFKKIINKKSLNKKLFYAIMLGAFYLPLSSANAVEGEDFSEERSESESLNAKAWPSDQSFTYYIIEKGGSPEVINLVKEEIQEWQKRGVGTNFAESEEKWSPVRIGVHPKGKDFAVAGTDALNVNLAKRTMNVKTVKRKNVTILLGVALTGIEDQETVLGLYNQSSQMPVEDEEEHSEGASTPVEDEEEHSEGASTPVEDEEEHSEGASTPVAAEEVLNLGAKNRIRLKADESRLYSLPEGLEEEFKIITRGWMDTYLTLKDETGNVIVKDDNSGRRDNAEIRFTLKGEEKCTLELLALNDGQCSIAFGQKRKR